jgi:hypothetical protein
VADGARELKFRDPVRAAALAEKLDRTVSAIGRSPVSVMHVCGSHEQAIARDSPEFQEGLRAFFEKREPVFPTHVDRIVDALRRVMPDPKHLAVSARTGEGIAAWVTWLRDQETLVTPVHDVEAAGRVHV